MRVEIFKVPPRVGEWAPSGPSYAFRPPTGDVGVYAVVEAPPGWMLVGEPEPLLVLRTGSSEFTTRTATEVFYHALLGAEAFAFAEAPAEGLGEAEEVHLRPTFAWRRSRPGTRTRASPTQ